MGRSQKNRYVYCCECGCFLEMNGVCKICGHIDNPLLPGMVPDLAGMFQETASELLTNGECQLTLGNVTTENSETTPIDMIISSDPTAGTELNKNDPVNIVVSLGPVG